MLLRKLIDGKLAAALVAAILAVGLWTPDNSLAQGAVDEDSGSPRQISIGREQLMALIANEVLLAPGVGLRNIRLGEVLATVQNRLGPPINISEKGVFKKTSALLYQLDGGTKVVLSGRTQISQISVTGTSAALVRTVQGARFGMDPRIIQRIYRTPSKAKRNRLEYKHLGITFYFGEKGVNRMDLYPSKT